MRKYFIVLTLLNFPFIHSVEEVDWSKVWPTWELQGTEHLTTIEPEEIENCSVAVTYALDRGRFGDQLSNYIKAFWVSWKFQLPFIYRPFDYSEELKLSENPLIFDHDTIQQFSRKIEFIHDNEKILKTFRQLENLQFFEQDPTLCIISFLTPFLEVEEDEKWDDEQFRALLQDQIRPKNSFPILDLPKDEVTVALHIRTGVGYDWQVNIDNMPTKFPPDTFYLNALKHLCNQFTDQSFYIQLFTDDPNPQSIRERILASLDQWGINAPLTISCRTLDNRHDLNVLEDLFAMTQFDCLIRPDSSFTRNVAAISAPLIEVKPIHWDFYRKDEKGEAILDKNGRKIVDCQVICRDKKGSKISQRKVCLIDDTMLF